MANPVVFFDMEIGGRPAGRIEMTVRGGRRVLVPHSHRPVHPHAYRSTPGGRGVFEWFRVELAWGKRNSLSSRACVLFLTAPR